LKISVSPYSPPL
jgi:hypothetical protein